MLNRLKWAISGIVVGALGLSVGGLVVETKRQRTAERLEQLTIEHHKLAEQAARLERERQQLADVVERLNVERRMAHIEVLQQHTNARGEVLQTVIRLREIGRDGEPLPEQVFGIPSAVPHFDALVIKFERDYVEKGDALRGHSLALFRRVYGETQAPEDGYWFSPPGSVPDIYRVESEPTDFELKLWRDFWAYAADPEKARGAGVRVAQGEAVYAPMRTGEHWLLTLEADGGLNLVKQDGVSTLPGDPVKQAASAAEQSTEDQGDRNLEAPSPLAQKEPGAVD